MPEPSPAATRRVRRRLPGPLRPRARRPRHRPACRDTRRQQDSGADDAATSARPGAGCRQSSLGGATCTTWPSLSTATLPAMESATPWSWVDSTAGSPACSSRLLRGGAPWELRDPQLPLRRVVERNDQSDGGRRHGRARDASHRTEEGCPALIHNGRACTSGIAPSATVERETGALSIGPSWWRSTAPTACGGRGVLRRPDAITRALRRPVATEPGPRWSARRRRRR